MCAARASCAFFPPPPPHSPSVHRHGTDTAVAVRVNVDGLRAGGTPLCVSTAMRACAYSCVYVPRRSVCVCARGTVRPWRHAARVYRPSPSRQPTVRWRCRATRPTTKRVVGGNGSARALSTVARSPNGFTSAHRSPRHAIMIYYHFIYFVFVLFFTRAFAIELRPDATKNPRNKRKLLNCFVLFYVNDTCSFSFLFFSPEILITSLTTCFQI